MASDEYVYADDLINVLKRKHEANAYASMVFYLEACESGSIFEGLLPETLNIYAITAANATEDSFAAYCPDDYPYISPAYDVCLGDVYSVSWIEDSMLHYGNWFWDCLGTIALLAIDALGYGYEEHWGTLSRYGMKYMRAIANMCHARITAKQMNMAAARICK